MGIFNFLFSDKESEKFDSVSTSKMSTQPDNEGRIAKLERELETIKELLRYEESQYVFSVFGPMRLINGPSITFPCGTKRQIKTIPATKETTKIEEIKVNKNDKKNKK